MQVRNQCILKDEPGFFMMRWHPDLFYKIISTNMHYFQPFNRQYLYLHTKGNFTLIQFAINKYFCGKKMPQKLRTKICHRKRHKNRHSTKNGMKMDTGTKAPEAIARCDNTQSQLRKLVQRLTVFVNIDIYSTYGTQFMKCREKLSCIESRRTGKSLKIERLMV